jgi:hypothetical protein
MSHMPGPWEIVSKFVGPYEIHANGDRIAMVGSDIDPFSEEHSVVATALLIAAAPDLLAALEYACEAEWDGIHEPRWMTVAREALKKARGL